MLNTLDEKLRNRYGAQRFNPAQGQQSMSYQEWLDRHPTLSKSNMDEQEIRSRYDKAVSPEGGKAYLDANPFAASKDTPPPKAFVTGKRPLREDGAEYDYVGGPTLGKRGRKPAGSLGMGGPDKAPTRRKKPNPMGGPDKPPPPATAKKQGGMKMPPPAFYDPADKTPANSKKKPGVVSSNRTERPSTGIARLPGPGKPDLKAAAKRRNKS